MKSRLGVAVLAGITLFATAAAADTSADALFAKGKALVAARRYAEACPVLAESVRIEPGIGARLWLGDCLEKSGQPNPAYAEFDAAARAAAARKDDREKVALRLRDALRPKVTLVSVIVQSPIGGFELKQDGVVLTAEDLDRPRPIAAGVHTFSASAPGRKEWSVSVTIPTQPDTTAVNVPILEVAPVLEPVIAAPAPAPAPSPSRTLIIERTREEASSRSTPWRIAALAVGAVGIAALGGGVFLGFQAKATYDSSNRGGHCVNDACDAEGKGLRQDATSMATLSTIAVAGAGGALAASVLMYLFAPTTTVAPRVGPTEAGLYATHRF